MPLRLQQPARGCFIFYSRTRSSLQENQKIESTLQEEQRICRRNRKLVHLQEEHNICVCSSCRNHFICRKNRAFASVLPANGPLFCSSCRRAAHVHTLYRKNSRRSFCSSCKLTLCLQELGHESCRLVLVICNTAPHGGITQQFTRSRIII